MISLNQVCLNKKCQILKLNVDGPILRRFIDIGIIPGASIEKILISPFGGISVYYIMGTSIAIRDQDVEGVIVDYE